MDKIATNNFIVVLRKDVKNAKVMVAGNLVRKIKELKKVLEKETAADATQKSKIDAKITKIQGEIKSLKDLDSYIICKKVMLKPDPKYWKDLVSDSRAGTDECLRARVICKGKVQKEVAKFRSDHPDCDEWLEEYFEFREKKRELTEAKVKEGKRKKKLRRDNNEMQDKPKQIKARRSRANSGVKDQRENQNRLLKPGRRNPELDQLHPSWASKRREKELIKQALSKTIPTSINQQTPANRVILNTE